MTGKNNESIDVFFIKFSGCTTRRGDESLVSATGASLIGISLLDDAGFKINETALLLFMETAKYRGIPFLLKELECI